MPKFEVFTKRMIPLSKDPSVTIQKKGIISLNAASYAVLGEPKFVELLYAADEQIVGIRAVDGTQDHAYPVRGSAGDGAFLISGIAFTNHYGIPTGIAVRRKAYVEDDTLCIDLKHPGIEITGNRKSAKASASEPPAAASDEATSLVG